MTALRPLVELHFQDGLEARGGDVGDGVTVGAVGDRVVHCHLVSQSQRVGGGSGWAGCGQEVGCRVG